MTFETVNGIVLRYSDYKESDRIFTLLTKERGLVSVNARGVRSKSKTASGMVKDTYCFGEFVLYERNGIEYVSSSSLIEAFYPIREDYDKLVVAAKIAKIAGIVAHGHASEEMFSLVYHAFSFIAYGENDEKDILICFLVKCMEAAGYAPQITRCVCCGKSVLHEKTIAFSCNQGGSLCPHCERGEKRYSALALEALRRMLLLEEKNMGRVKLPESTREELNELLFGYAELVLEKKLTDK